MSTGMSQGELHSLVMIYECGLSYYVWKFEVTTEVFSLALTQNHQMFDKGFRQKCGVDIIKMNFFY